VGFSGFSAAARSNRRHPSQVLPKALEARVTDLSFRRPSGSRSGSVSAAARTLLRASGAGPLDRSLTGRLQRRSAQAPEA
jgi:hypothetical protein